MKTGGTALALLLAGCGTGCGPAGEDGGERAPELGSSTERTSPSVDAEQASAGGAQELFTDRTASWGVDFRHDAGLTPEKHLPETMGHGAALFDADGDGDLDLYLVQGGTLPGLSEVPGGGRPTNRLFANAGDGSMEDVTAAAGEADHDGYGMGVVVGDVDADGDADLFLTNFGPDALLLGDGGGSYRDVTAEGVLGDGRWTTGACLFDAENDGDLDLYVAAYVEVDLADPPWCGRREPGWRTVCHPDRFPGLQDRFYRNDGSAGFSNETVAAGLADSAGKGLGVFPADFDDDGFQDLYVANDSVENRFWHNRRDGTFRDETLLSGTGVDVNGATEAGMGIACGDFDGDADLDVFVTNFDHESHTLYRNDGELLFTDVTAAAGLEAPTRMPVGFGTAMEDFDQDGDLDLAVANGHIVDRIAMYDGAQTWRQRPQLFANDGTGRFREAGTEAGAFVREPLVGRGLYSGDLDGDGDLDLVLTVCGGATRLFENRIVEGRRGSAGSVILRGLPRGARVDCLLSDGRRLLRHAVPGTSYLGQSAPGVHVGTGPARLERLRVRAPGAEPVELAVDPGGGAFLDWAELSRRARR